MRKICVLMKRVFFRIITFSVISLALLVANSCEKEVQFNPEAALTPQEGATLYGRVYCGDKPLKGVSVSDGVTVVRTDSEGVYNISSSKINGYVFVSVPSGYAMADATAVSPKFWQSVDKSEKGPERVDFKLVEENQDVFTMLVLGDTQIFNSNSVNLFRNTVIPELNTYVNSVATGPVYGLNLGDMTWDWYWYNGERVNPTHYLLAVKGLDGLPLFHTVGNHDNDMQYDSLTEFQTTGEDRTCMDYYRSKMGPTCFSYNIGGVHFVSLDDVITTNTGGTTDKDSRGYMRGVTKTDMKWLEQDLAGVSKYTPVIVSIHMPLFNMSCKPIVGDANSVNADVSDIVAPFKKFEKVLFISGHTHYLYNVENYEVGGVQVTEWNNGAICGNYWKTAVKGLNLCNDGTPGGYRIMTFKNGKYSSIYKGIGKNTNYMFRTYDRNMMNIDASSLGKYTAGYIAGENKDNWVYIYIWDYKPSWKLTVEEVLSVDDNKTLFPARIDSYDPLYSMMYATGLSSTEPRKALTMFRVQASKPNTTLLIEVRDEYGNRRSETMRRPKSFDLDTYIREQAE